MVEKTETESIVRQAPYLEEWQKTLLEDVASRGEAPIGSVYDPETETYSGGLYSATPEEQQLYQVAGLDPLQTDAMKLVGGYDPETNTWDASKGIGQFQDYITDADSALGDALTPYGAALGGVYDPETGTYTPGGVRDVFSAAETAAEGSAGTFDPSQVASFMDPYASNVTAAALEEMNRQQQLDEQALARQKIGAGSFGGGRHGIQAAEMGRNWADVRTKRIYEDLSRNWSQAQNAAQTAFENQQRRQQGVAGLLTNLGSAVSTSATQRAGTTGALATQQANLGAMGQGLMSDQAKLMTQMGGMEQAQSQRELDATQRYTMQQAMDPYTRIGWMSDIFKPQIGSAASTLSTSTAPSPSGVSQAIGAGIAGLGLNRALDNPFGAVFKSFTGDS